MGVKFIRLNPVGVAVLMVSATLIFLFLYSSSHSSYAEQQQKISLRTLLAVSITAAGHGGDAVKKVRDSADLKQKSKGKTKEGANDPLTEGDLRSHRIMTHTLKKNFPTLKVISEEHDESDATSFYDSTSSDVQFELPNDVLDDIEVPVRDVTVWVDPLDATQEYTESLLQYVTTMVCVAVKGKPVIGVIYQPFEDKMSWAWVGHGMSENLKEVRTLAMEGMKNAAASGPVVIVSRSHAGKVTEVVNKAFGPASKVVPAGGAGYKTLRVMQGHADAYVHITLIKKWDICAGNALLTAVGGTMTTLEGHDIKYDEQDGVRNDRGLVATMHNHEAYLKALAQLDMTVE